MKFTKMHGCGNDYIYVNTMKEKVDNPSEISRDISRYHFGIGSDGLILVGDSDTADFSMRIFNSDGSEAEMCGNGVRCVGKFVYDKKLTNKDTVSVSTLGGIKTLKLNIENDKCIGAVVNMGKPVFEPKKIPVDLNTDIVKEHKVKTEFGDFEITAVSMGNPHCVIFVDDTEFDDFIKIGALFERHPLFIKGTNVEFVQVVDRKTLKMRVYERGAAETLACGTGACASLVAAVITGRADREATLQLKGGDLKISWLDDNADVYMSGPAVTVFEGEINV